MADAAFINRLFNEAYIREYQKAAILHYPPLWITLGICSACANKCSFCAYHAKEARKTSKIYNVPFLMPQAYAAKLIDFFHRGGVPKIHICATGEPLFHPEFFPILDHVIARYGFVSFQSDFPKDLVEKRDAIKGIIARKDAISSISVDLMANPAIKDGDEDYLLFVLKRLKAGGIGKIGATFLLTRANWRDLEILARKLHKLNLQLPLRCALVFPYGMNKFTDPENLWDQNRIARDEAEGLEEIIKMARSLGVRIWPPRAAGKGCDVFWKKMQIWPTRGSAPGRLDNLIPHGCNAVVMGDMASFGYVEDYSDVMEMWNNPFFVASRKKFLSGGLADPECGNCPFKWANADGRT